MLIFSFFLSFSIMVLKNGLAIIIAMAQAHSFELPASQRPIDTPEGETLWVWDVEGGGATLGFMIMLIIISMSLVVIVR